jgi:hypothetical protein
MKPLKRPMFRSGGPIKEGIMEGMQEPQAVNTVGSPLAPRGNGWSSTIRSSDNRCRFNCS